MTNQLKALLAAGVVASTSALNAEIVLTEDLSLSGYIDMGMSDFDSPGDTFSADIYQVEMDFNFTTETYSAVAELAYDGFSVEFETVTITYGITDELSVTAGNILSYMGWETYDSTGLYQFTYAYRNFLPLYPAYAVGASLDYTTDMFSFGVWVGEGGSEEVSVEVAGKFTGVEGLTIFVGYADDPTYEMYNVWGSYEIEGFTFALEYVNWEDMPSGSESVGYLAMVNYAVDNFGFTVRYSVQEDETAAGVTIGEDWEALTFSPSYAFSDNLLGLIEYSAILDGGYFGDADTDYAWGVELIYTY